MTEVEHDHVVFNKLIKINKEIWGIIVDIQNFTEETDSKQIRDLVDLSGHLHVDILRPLYKKYPELEKLLD